MSLYNSVVILTFSMAESNQQTTKLYNELHHFQMYQYSSCFPLLWLKLEQIQLLHKLNNNK
jgi:hypothetical protein